MPPDVLPLIRSRANPLIRPRYGLICSVLVFSPRGLSAEMRAWESGCLGSDMWCRDKIHVVITYNMFWYALHQKSCVHESQCLCVCAHNYFSQHQKKKKLKKREKYCEFLFSEGIYVDFPDHLSYVNSAVSVDTPCLWSRLGMGNEGAPLTF